MNETRQKVAHTPGPWTPELVVPSDRATWGGPGPDGFRVAESQTARERAIEVRSTTEHMRGVFGSAEGGLICIVPVTYDGLEQAKANASVLSAASDLLDFVFDLATYGDCDCDEMSNPKNDTDCDVCRAGRLLMKHRLTVHDEVPPPEYDPSGGDRPF